MKEYKRTVVFIDKARNKFEVKCEITFRNGYPEFTTSGNYGGSSGQCLDNIVPANKYQKKLVDIWDKWHLNSRNNNLPKNFKADLDILLDNIEEAEEERKSTPLVDTFKDDYELYKFIDDNFDFTSDEIPIVMMFCHEDNLCKEDLDDIEFERSYVTVQGTEYLAGTDSEMDEKWDEDLESYIDDCVIGCIGDKHARDMLETYFDREAWKRDARMDGRGNSLNRYDGGEIEYEFDNTWYYAYRQ